MCGFSQLSVNRRGVPGTLKKTAMSREPSDTEAILCTTAMEGHLRWKRNKERGRHGRRGGVYRETALGRDSEEDMCSSSCLTSVIDCC